MGNGRQLSVQEQQRRRELAERPQPPRLPAPTAEQLERLGLSRVSWKLLTDTVWPGARTVDGVMMAVAYCQARKLDPMKKPVHVVSMWSSEKKTYVDTVWPGIGELRTTAARTTAFAGCDSVVFGPMVTRGFRDADGTREAMCGPIDFPMWAQLTIYRMVEGQRVAFVGPKVFFIEAFAGEKGLQVPNSMWQKRPCGQLEKCAEAAALRRAFPEEIGEQYAAEEMDGKELIGHNGGPRMEDGAAGAIVGDPKAEQRASDEDWVAKIEAGCAEERSLSALEQAIKADREEVDQLDEDHRDRVHAAWDAARERLAPAVEDAEVGDDEAAEFAAAFRAQLKVRTTVDAIDTWFAKNESTLDELPAALAADLRREVEEHRDSAAIIAGDGGEQAPADHNQAPQED